jgi:hypothetical protein
LLIINSLGELLIRHAAYRKVEEYGGRIDPVIIQIMWGIRYTVKKEDFGKFEAILASNMMPKFNCDKNKEGFEIRSCV